MCVGETEDGLSYSERQARKARGKSTDLTFLPRRSTRKSTDLIFLPRVGACYSLCCSYPVGCCGSAQFTGCQDDQGCHLNFILFHTIKLS